MIAPPRVQAERFRGVITSRLGLYFDDAKLDELGELLDARRSAIGAINVDDYLRRIDDQELDALATRLTVGETYFFRYREQLDAFRDVALAETLKRTNGPIRILSAGCATGDEPYSLAMTILDHAPQAAVRTEIVAFDLNPSSLAKAREGVYAPWALREIADDDRPRHFSKHGTTYRLARDVRDMVRFEQRNLVLEDPAFWRAGAFDIVFCRNVVMYFDVETMRSVIRRIAKATNPRAFLFLGHAETLRGISNDFHLRHSHETFYYERKGEGDHVADRPREPRDEPRVTTFVATPTGHVAEDASWVDVIQRASERVAKLSTAPTAPHATRDEPAERGKILEMVRAERFAEALELLGTRDEDPESRLLRAVLLTNRGDLALAESICGDILSSDDLNAGAHYVKALCREHAGDRESAIAHDRMATYLEPTFTMPHIHIGILERRAGRLDRARAEIVRALELIAAEDPSRILLFGGGFSRDALATLCRNELRRCGGTP